MDKLGNLLKKRPKKKPSKYITKEYQFIGIQKARDLGIHKKDYGQIIKAFMKHPDVAQKAFTYVIDAKNVQSPLSLFFFKYWDILKKLKSLDNSKFPKIVS